MFASYSKRFWPIKNQRLASTSILSGSLGSTLSKLHQKSSIRSQILNLAGWIELNYSRSVYSFMRRANLFRLRTAFLESLEINWSSLFVFSPYILERIFIWYRNSAQGAIIKFAKILTKVMRPPNSHMQFMKRMAYFRCSILSSDSDKMRLWKSVCPSIDFGLKESLITDSMSRKVKASWYWPTYSQSSFVWKIFSRRTTFVVLWLKSLSWTVWTNFT